MGSTFANPTNLPCKFNAAHGVFTNPTKLRQHYDEQHAHEYVTKRTKRYRCKICGKVVAIPTSHLYELHPDRPPKPEGVAIANFYFEPEESLPSRAAEQVSNLDRYRPKEQHHDSLHPWAVDDIVLPVMGQLAEPSGMIPIEHLAAIFAWREATSMLLETISKR